MKEIRGEKGEVEDGGMGDNEVEAEENEMEERSIWAVWLVDRPLIDRLVDGLLETDRLNSSRHPDRPTFFK